MLDRRVTRLLTAAAVLVWLTLFISLYFIYHKPIDAALAAALLRRAAEMIVGLGLIIIAGGLGGKIFPQVSHRPLYSAAWQVAIGLGVLGTGYLIIGASIGVSWITAGGVLLALMIFYRKESSTWIKTTLRGFGNLRPRSRLGIAASLGVFVVLGSGLLTALSPPLKFDALVYHLALPKQYLAIGRFDFDPTSWFWGMPQLGEMLYTLAMALAGERAAAILGWGVALLALGSLWELTANLLGPQPAWVALAALLGGSTLSTSLGTAYVDWLVILFAVSMLGAFVDWLWTREPVELCWAGLATGLAMGTKYTAGILAIGGVVLILITQMRTRAGIRRMAGSVTRFGLPALFLVLPWLIKTWIATGNPLYPFLFPENELESFRQKFYSLSPWGKTSDMMILPFLASIQGLEGTPGYSASIGPLLAGLAPLAIFIRNWGRAKHRQIIAGAAILCLTTWAIWAVGSRVSGLLIQTRLYFACLPAAALLAGAGFRGLQAIHLPGIRVGRISGTLILLVFGFSVFQSFDLILQQGVPQVVFGAQEESEFLEHNLGWYAIAMKGLDELPPEARILMLWEPRSLSCTPACTSDDILDRWIVARRQWRDVSRIREAWSQLGYTHLLFNNFGARFIQSEDLRYSQADWETLNVMLGDLPVVSRFDEAYTLYGLVP